MGRIRWRGREVGSTKEGGTDGTCSEMSVVMSGVYNLATSEGRRIDGLTRDAGIVELFLGIRVAREISIEDGSQEAKGDRGCSSYSLTTHQETERSGDGGLPTNLQTSSEHVWFDLSSQQKVVAAHLFPTWYTVDFSCLRWSTKILHCAYPDRHNHCWLC